MDPQKRTLCVPLIEDAPSEEPCGGSILVGLATNVVIFRRIWRAEPGFGVLLHLLTCNSYQPVG